MGNGLARKGKKVLLIDLDPQGDLTTSLGYKNQDNMEITIKNIMEKVIQEKPISKNEGILQNAEGVNLMPANIELEALDISLVKYINKENILKQYIDNVKEDYDYILIDCRPSLGLLTIITLSAVASAFASGERYIPITVDIAPL